MTKQSMKACTMANGAVFFIPEEVEREVKSLSYKDLIKGDEVLSKPAKKMSLFDRLMKRDRFNAQSSQQSSKTA